MRSDDVLRIVHIYPTVLGLYGDRGNALVLAARAERRGIAAEIVAVEPGEAVPETGDLYLLGGGEDLAQTTAADLLRADGTLARLVARDAVLFAVCAGMQILGEQFAAASGTIAGLGLVDITTVTGATRAVGELLVEDLALPIDELTGYENHRGRTTIGPDARPLGRVRTGTGNGDGTEGVISGRTIGTYLHGPALARNPQLADVLLAWATGATLAPLADPLADALRDERLTAVRRDPTRWTPDATVARRRVHTRRLARRRPR